MRPGALENEWKVTRQVEASKRDALFGTTKHRMCGPNEDFNFFAGRTQNIILTT
jgi:hypothetical protein